MKKEGWSVGNLGDGLPRLRRGENGLPRKCEHWLTMTGAPGLARNDRDKTVSPADSGSITLGDRSH